MPDFERLTRSLELHLCKTEAERLIVAARHLGESAARKQVAWIAGGIGFLILLFHGCEPCPAMDRWSALSQIESGDNDGAVGRAGEVSRYQIMPRNWPGGNPRDQKHALSVARSIMDRNTGVFVTRFGRQPNDFEFYVLWNAPAQIARPSKAVTDRAQRFADLVARRSDKEREYG